jgi:hypothetical protein
VRCAAGVLAVDGDVAIGVDADEVIPVQVTARNRLEECSGRFVLLEIALGTTRSGAYVGNPDLRARRVDRDAGGLATYTLVVVEARP